MSRLDNTNDRQFDVLIVGASARSAAQSAVRAGLRPICADLFADEDLRAVADVIPLSSLSNDLPVAIRHIPPCPWMYTGALENRPRIIEEISAQRPLWGNPAESLALVRSQHKFQRMLQDAGLPTAAVRSASDPPPADGSWLIKPLHGASGRGIVTWNGATAPVHRELHYFQQRIDGLPCSAVCIATRNRTHLVGISQQRIGDPLLNATGFAYCGSSGPIFFNPNVVRQIEKSADVIARGAKLRGIFGIDLIFDGAAAIPIEVNPRYTASVEIFEHACDVPLLAWHRLACVTFTDHAASSEADAVIDAGRPGNGPIKHVEKAILYADRAICTPSLGGDAVRPSVGPMVILADRPPAGTRIEAGRPVCTLLVIGPDETACCETMGRAVMELKQLLAIAATSIDR